MIEGGLMGGLSGLSCGYITRLNQNYSMPRLFQGNQINEFHWRKTKPQNMSEISLTLFFFLKNIGELRVIILRREKGKSLNNPTHAHTHAPPVQKDLSYFDTIKR